MSFRILQARGADAEAWREMLSRLPATLRDIHYLPEYGLIHADCYGDEPFLALLEEPSGFVMQVFIRRRLNDHEFLSANDTGETFIDVAGPYGFGGPLASDPQGDATAQRLRRFDAELRAYLLAEHVATEFTCLHPLLGNHVMVERAGTAELVRTKEVVVIDLAQDEQALWRGVSRGTRGSISVARRGGITVEQVDPGPAELATFRDIYLETMRRRNAAPRWFFPARYFEVCAQRLGARRVALFFAYCDGAVAAAYLLMCDERTAYYHFGGSRSEWLDRRPNKVLMYETVLWARRRGLAAYHLGGGVTAAGDDGLLRFKSSFGGDRRTLYTYGRVHDAKVYARLCALKIEHEHSTLGMTIDRDYFPLYRR